MLGRTGPVASPSTPGQVLDHDHRYIEWLLRRESFATGVQVSGVHFELAKRAIALAELGRACGFSTMRREFGLWLDQVRDRGDDTSDCNVTYGCRGRRGLCVSLKG